MADRGISPRVTNSVDLGSASKAWRKLYVGRIDEGTYVNGAFNKKVTYTSSGTFVAPVTGVYRITLQGGGGGGGGAGNNSSVANVGGGGGGGAHLDFYETLAAGVSYPYTIGAGGAGGSAGTGSTDGTAGSSGGGTSISLNSSIYEAGGGYGGYARPSGYMVGGNGGVGKINNTVVCYGYPGQNGNYAVSNRAIYGGRGGGASSASATAASNFGGGGNGGIFTGSDGTYAAGRAGGDGYITFEYYDTNA